MTAIRQPGVLIRGCGRQEMGMAADMEGWATASVILFVLVNSVGEGEQP